MNRREFLKLSSLAGVGCFSLTSPRLHGAALPGGDYRALVVIMLTGGNDAFNMLIPTAPSTYTSYAATRGSLAVADTALSLPPDLLTAGLNPYATEGGTANEAAYRAGHYALAGTDLGVNGVMPELAGLLGSGRASAVLGSGNLVRPVDRQQITDGVADLPLFLFAHNHQQRQIEIGRADSLSGPGWAGQLADLWFGGYDPDYPLGLNVSLGGTSRLQAGRDTAPLIMSAKGPTDFKAFSVEGETDTFLERRNANRQSLYAYLTGNPQAPGYEENAFPRPQDYRDAEPFVPQSLFKGAYQRFANRAQSVTEQFNDDWLNTLEQISYSTPDSYGLDLFAVPDDNTLNLTTHGTFGSFIGQLEAIATMAKLGSDRGYGRHIFLARLNGFDTHSGQADAHPSLLRELSLGLDKFDRALGDLGLRDNVMACTASDFGRTLSNNGDGTDHGWATHQLVLGGAPTKPAVVGEAPQLSLGSDDDYSDKGRMIPRISNDQITATAIRWLGASPAELETLLPNLRNFASDPADLETALLSELIS